MLNLQHLPNEVPGEEVVHALHRHPFTILWLVLGYAFLLCSVPAIAWYLPTYQPAIVSDPILMPLIILGGSVFFLFAWLFLFQNFMDYYLDFWIVTTKRILNIEQTGLFARTTSELRLYRVQDVTSTVKGVFETLLDFGNVEIQTAGEKTHFVFEQIAHPTRVSKTILELAEKERREQLSVAVEEFDMPDKQQQSPKV